MLHTLHFFAGGNVSYIFPVCNSRSYLQVP